MEGALELGPGATLCVEITPSAPDPRKQTAGSMWNQANDAQEYVVASQPLNHLTQFITHQSHAHGQSTHNLLMSLNWKH